MVRTNRRFRCIEAEGFYHGVHVVPTAPMEAAIVAQCTGDAHQVRHDAVDSIRDLEGALKVLEGRQPGVDKHWQLLHDETDGRRPEIGLPLVAIATALLAVGGETLLLAPVMDGFGIAEPLWQAVTAGTLVIVASGLIHLALHRLNGVLLREASPQTLTRVPAATAVTALVAAFALTLVTALGWWRAAEMIFAGDAQKSVWSGFLHQNEILTRICVTLLTLGLPLFAAVGFNWGFDQLRYAVEWRRARQTHLRVMQGIEVTRKSLEAVTDKRDHQVRIIDQKMIDWLESYRENYELGHRMGAQKQALWRVLLHIVAVILLLAACCVVLDLWLGAYSATTRVLAYGLLTLGLGGLYAYLVLRAWDRPSPAQLFRQRAVIWRAPTDPSLGSKLTPPVESSTRIGS